MPVLPNLRLLARDACIAEATLVNTWAKPVLPKLRLAPAKPALPKLRLAPAKPVLPKLRLAPAKPVLPKLRPATAPTRENYAGSSNGI